MQGDTFPIFHFHHPLGERFQKKRIFLAYVVWDNECGGGRAPDTGTDRQEGVAEGHQPQQVEHAHTEEMWRKHRPAHYAA